MYIDILSHNDLIKANTLPSKVSTCLRIEELVSGMKLPPNGKETHELLAADGDLLFNSAK